MSKILVDENDLQVLCNSARNIINILTNEQKNDMIYEIKKVELFTLEYDNIIQLKKQEKAYFNLYEKLKNSNPEESKKAYYCYKEKKSEREEQVNSLNKLKRSIY